MTAYYVNNSAGGANTGGSWTDAFLTLLQATAVATDADQIYIASTHTETVGGALTLTLPSTQGLRIISTSDTTNMPPTTLAAGAVVQIGATANALTIRGNGYVFGVNFYGGTNASIACDIFLGSNTPTNLIFESCTLECKASSAGAVLNLTPIVNAANDEVLVRLINTAIGVGHASSTITLGAGKLECIGVTLTGTAPTNMFSTLVNSGGSYEFNGCDLSGVAYTNLVSGVASTVSSTFRFTQCKLRSGYTALLSVATNAYSGGAEVFVNDCDTGDTHGTFGYFNPLGSVVSDAGVYFTAGAAGQSWKVTTASSVTFAQPFRTPWIDRYNTTLSAQTPYLEILRTGASPPRFKNDEVWVECLAKTAGASPLSSLTTDRRGQLAANADQDAGAGFASWTGSDSNDSSDKLAVASLTPAENGHIRMRVAVGLASIAGTLYIDPQIRT